MKVYILTSGCYSDYSIVSVYLDKEKAEAAAELFNRKDRYAYCSVEEYTLEEDLPVTLYGIRIRADITGKMVEEEMSPITVSASQVANWYGQVHPVVSPSQEVQFWGSAHGRTPELARKSLYDAIAKAKAEYYDL